MNRHNRHLFLPEISEKKIPAFRSNINNRKVVEVWHDKLYLFELGKHWYYFDAKKMDKPIPIADKGDSVNSQ